MSDKELQLVDVKLIDSNPFQKRQVTDLDGLIKDFKDHADRHPVLFGMLQPPSARKVDGRYQLRFGHRRLSAWKTAYPGKKVTVISGNFLTWSFVFNIHTNESRVIKQLTQLIRANQKTKAYREAQKKGRK